MKHLKWMTPFIMMLMLLLVSCSNDVSEDATTDDDANEEPKTEASQSSGDNEEKPDDDSVVTIDGDDMTYDDLEFYTLMDKIKIELNRAEDEKNLTGDELTDKNAYWDEQIAQYENVNIGLQSMIEIKSMSLLAEEKNYFVPDEKLDKKVKDFEKKTDGNEAVDQLIAEYGEKDYQYHLREYVRQSSLRDRVAEDLSDDIAEENPDASELERNFLLNDEFEDLFVDQLASLEVTIHLE